MIEDGIIDSIITAWSRGRWEIINNPGNVPAKTLSRDRVKQLIETAFFASLKKEEDTEVRFAVALADPGEVVISQNHSPDAVIEFAEDVAFTAHNVCKLASAFEPRCSILAVGARTGTSELKIWGVFHFAPIKHRFNEIPASIGREISFPPDLLTAKIISPGSLIIARANLQIGRFVNGAFTPSLPSPFSSQSLGGPLCNLILNNPLWQKHKVNYWNVFSNAIQVLLNEAADRGHGTTIILVDSDKIEDYLPHLRPRYQLRQTLGLSRLIEKFFEVQEIVKVNHQGILHVAANNLIFERIKMFAQLASIDGALVMTSDLDVIGFGVSLLAPHWKGKVLTGPDAYGINAGEIFEYAHLGMRHNSAIDFIGVCPKCFAFVISQDGPIRAFTLHDENTIHVWPDCTTSMFVD